ncbi:MAG: hypothetical protein QX189_18925 [Methylococcales bacterium]|jgi:hypothetical protein
MTMLNTKQIQALANANAIRSVLVNGTDNGFTILVNESLIETKRGHPRIFKKLQTVTAYLRTNGIPKFTVDVSSCNPEQRTVI